MEPNFFAFAQSDELGQDESKKIHSKGPEILLCVTVALAGSGAAV